jgi:nitrile hydratase subunit beta
VNGAHDMGGAHGFGPVVPEVDEPYFHADWERRVLGLVIAMGAAGRWNIDKSRSAREDRDPAEYLSLSYYEIWLAGLERLLVNAGLVTADELARGESLEAPEQVRVLAPDDVPAMLARGGPADRPAPRPPRFEPGSRVRARNLHPRGHTRLPRYARGHVGVIERVHGCHVFADHNALGDEDPQWLYSVRFDATELFGPDADPRSQVSFDAFEPYLEPV